MPKDDRLQKEESSRLTGIVQLVEGIRAGDCGAVSTLHEKFSDRIYFVALRELRSAADAEDIRNETFLRVIQAVRDGKLTTAAALPGFLLGIARNVTREVARKGWRAESLADRDFAAEPASDGVDHTVKRAIEAVLLQMKPRERDFVRLYYYDELPKEEISERLGIHADRVRLLKSRTLKSFREIYARVTGTGGAAQGKIK